MLRMVMIRLRSKFEAHLTMFYIAGVLFYLIAWIAALISPSLVDTRALVFIMSIGSLTMSAILAYVMIVIIKGICLVCLAMYACSILFFIISLLDWTRVTKVKVQKHLD